MVDIREFTTDQLFGIKARDNSVRTGVKVATLGRYVSATKSFAVNMISSEGVAGSNQALRFEDRLSAQRWIDQNHARFGYDEGEMQVMRTVGTNSFWKVPVDGYDIPGWVNTRKFNYVSDSQMEKFKREIPEYFDADSDARPNGYRDGIDAMYTEDPETGELIPRETNQSSYRGFRF